MTDDATAAVLVYEGFEELDAVGPYDVLGAAAEAGADLRPRIVADADDGDASGPSGGVPETVTASRGLVVEPHGGLPGPEAPPEYLIVPGGGWNASGGGDGDDGGGDRESVGGNAGDEDGDGDGAVASAADRRAGARAAAAGPLPGRIRALYDAGTTVLSVCTGAMVLKRAGLLDGRPAVTHHSALADLRTSDAEVVEARVVDDGDLLTAGGVTAGIDAALWLVEREFGAEVAARTAETLEYERTDDVHEGPSGG